MKRQGRRQLETIKGIDEYYYGPDQKLLGLQKRVINETIDNIFLVLKSIKNHLKSISILT